MIIPQPATPILRPASCTLHTVSCIPQRPMKLAAGVASFSTAWLGPKLETVRPNTDHINTYRVYLWG